MYKIGKLPKEIEIKALSLFQGNSQTSDLKHDFWKSFTKQMQLFPSTSHTQLKISETKKAKKKYNETDTAILYWHDRTVINSTKREQKTEKLCYPPPVPPLKPEHKWITDLTPQPPYHIKCSNTMYMISLAQTRQSNGYGGVNNDNIFNLYLGSATGPQVSITASCKTQAMSIASILPNNHPRGKRILRKDLTISKSYCITLAYVRRTQC